jgi:hypothetical protein
MEILPLLILVVEVVVSALQAVYTLAVLAAQVTQQLLIGVNYGTTLRLSKK